MVGAQKKVAEPDTTSWNYFTALTRPLPLIFLALLAAHSLQGKEAAAYKLGDRISENIFTPVPLTVTDPEATETLKQKEMARIPVILHFDPTAADKAESELRSTFALNRSNFLNTIKTSFKRTKLTDADIASARFQRAMASFKRQNRAFPLTTNLAELWARGDSGRVIQADLIARVRETMSRPVRPLALPENIKLGYTVRLVTLARPEEKLTLDAADQRGVNILRSNITTLTRARTNLAGQFPIEQQALGKFAASRLRANTFVETELTRQDRLRRTGSLLSVSNYEIGQPIARAGQVVDKKILAALDQLLERTAPVRLQEQITVQQAEAAQKQAAAAQTYRRNLWLITGLAMIAVLSIAIAWRRARPKPNASLLPARITGPGGAALSLPPNDGVLAGGAEAAARAGMFAQLALLFREKLVRGLITQRSQLLDAQRMAAAEMADLEQRLNKLQAPLQDRLHAYEKRIAELEKALAAKGDENRELIKAKIELIRRQLETERKRDRLVLN